MNYKKIKNTETTNKDYNKCIHKNCSKCNDACYTFTLDNCICNYCSEKDCPECENNLKSYYKESEE